MDPLPGLPCWVGLFRAALFLRLVLGGLPASDALAAADCLAELQKAVCILPLSLFFSLKMSCVGVALPAAQPWGVSRGVSLVEAGSGGY